MVTKRITFRDWESLIVSLSESLRVASIFSVIFSALFIAGATGCRKQEPAAGGDAGKDAVAAKEQAPAEVAAPAPLVATAKELLEMRLPQEQASDGWIRLFDGYTLLGWQVAGNVDWKIANQTIEATKGDVALLCTSTQWDDYELEVEYNADENTNSGIFLRTDLLATDPAKGCYEFNIAPKDNPFPTGSLVARHRVEPDVVGELKAGEWHRIKLRIEGGHITASIDDKPVLDWTDPEPLPRNLIGLQHNSGRVSFRNVRMRPLGLKSLLDKELVNWTKYPNLGGKFEVQESGELRITGGKGQLESKESYGDFVLLADVRTNAPNVNGGIFFRAIPGEELNGYECQVSNAIKDGNPLTPQDCGIGGIFRRVEARVVAGADEQWASVLVYANGPQFATWVNGLPIVDWVDTRAADPNPRKGLRVEPGTIMLQAHDETTDWSVKSLSVKPL